MAIERCDVCLIMIDANEGVTEQDTKVAGLAHEAGKACIIVVNKWDAIEKDGKTMDKMRQEVMRDLSYMTYAPIVFISALTGQRVDRLFDLIVYVNNQAAMRITTGMLNSVLADATARVQPPTDKGRRLKIYGTDLWFPALVTAAIAYFCGCFNGAVIVSKYILRDDVRNHGSGNAGLTNFYRTFGGPLTFVVILCDVLKAVVAIKMAVWLTGQLLPLGSMEVHSAANALAEYWGGLWCLLGHMFPCMFHFRGGKGILSGGAIAIMIDWRIALVVWGGFLLLAVLTRYVSLGSCWAGASFPFATWFVYHDVFLTVFGACLGCLILYMHRGNIQRLLSGTENKFSLHHKKE